ncbi:D-alanine--D-alanine ligase [Candidatus Falkowbacteria bacterium]|nr:D-alanine--D-alanine ligase [Candidatus Falkowbacteria bacterium]NCT54560.1 D-alanine--D-alanine ligase [Candidatus Falkowbacteria bacterium]
MSKIKNIGVFFGGKSPEHEISIITGQLIISELKKYESYRIIPIYLDKQERFFSDDSLGSLAFFSQDGYEKKLNSLMNYDLSLKESVNKLVFKSTSIFPKKIVIDLAFPAFHGNLGEDGSMQGLFNIFNIPYVGCDAPASAIAMDKILTKIFYQGLGIKTTKFLSYSLVDWNKNSEIILKEVETNLRWPVFVKPPHLGSSIGITKVKKIEDLSNAIEVALHYDTKVIVEESVENLMDITCAVIGHKEPIASLIQESSCEEMFSYDDKYLDEGGAQLGRADSKIFIPARLDEEISEEIRATSKKIFTALGCSGISRFDFLYNKETKEFFANEINPMPGTLYHHLWQKSGIEISDLINLLISSALEKQEEKNKTVFSFSTTVLSKLKNSKLKFNK